MIYIECRDWYDTVLATFVIENKKQAWSKYQELSNIYPYVAAYEVFNQIWCSKSLWAFRERRTPEFSKPEPEEGRQ